ncbi:hypothetical protein LJB86_04950 [Deltaproteobacteria bacterium OttesenSCG-928-M10]|nr:hypothetical protein [Deltaproteobacteria bacterium OttesenSCG-928-M10]
MTTLTKIKITLAAAVVLAALGGWLYVKALSADNRRLALAAETARAEAGQWRQEAAGLRRALADERRAVIISQAIIAGQTAETAALKARLKEVYASDQYNQNWADSPCPPDVADCLLP